METWRRVADCVATFDVLAALARYAVSLDPDQRCMPSVADFCEEVRALTGNRRKWQRCG